MSARFASRVGQTVGLGLDRAAVSALGQIASRVRVGLDLCLGLVMMAPLARAQGSLPFEHIGLFFDAEGATSEVFLRDYDGPILWDDGTPYTLFSLYVLLNGAPENIDAVRISLSLQSAEILAVESEFGFVELTAEFDRVFLLTVQRLQECEPVEGLAVVARVDLKGYLDTWFTGIYLGRVLEGEGYRNCGGEWLPLEIGSGSAGIWQPDAVGDVSWSRIKARF